MITVSVSLSDMPKDNDASNTDTELIELPSVLRPIFYIRHIINMSKRGKYCLHE